MTSGEPNQSECYRMIVFGHEGAELLVAPNGKQYALPCVTIPRWQRVAENLAATVKLDWGEEVVCLFEPENEPLADGPTKYHVAEHVRNLRQPKLPTQWISVSALYQESLVDPDDYAAIMRAVCVINGEDDVTIAGPFARLGWFRELRHWIESVIEPMGFHLDAEFRQLNASSSFSLIRFATDGSALWFKAVGEPNEREFAIACALAQLFPCHLPVILAVRPDWNGWLTCEVQGKPLAELKELRQWEFAAAALARLQIESIGFGPQVLAAGARDLGSAELSKCIEPFMRIIADLMERQIKTPPDVLDREQLSDLTEALHRAVDAIGATGIPETVGHLDLNPWNIIVSQSRCAFLDWAEAYVGNPLFTLEYLLQHGIRALGADQAIRTKLIEAYCGQWDRIVLAGALTDALAFVPLLAVFAYAAGSEQWKEAEILDSAPAGHLRGMARRMHREVSELAARRALCLQ